MTFQGTDSNGDGDSESNSSSSQSSTSDSDSDSNESTNSHSYPSNFSLRNCPTTVPDSDDTHMDYTDADYADPHTCDPIQSELASLLDGTDMNGDSGMDHRYH